MFVVLITGITNAQTFDFGCETGTIESDLSAIYADGTTPPVLTDLINNTSDAVEASTDSSDFFKSLGADSGYTVASFSADEIGFYFRIDAIDTPKIYSEVGDIDTPASHRAFTLQIVKHIWDLLYPNYDYNAAAFASELTAIYGADAPPTGFVDGGAIETAASGFIVESTSGESKAVFIRRLASEYHLIKSVYQHISSTEAGLVHVNAPNHDLSPRITSPVAKALYQHDSPDMIAYALEVVKAIWLLDNPDYVTRLSRIAEVKTLGNSNVTVTEDYDTVRGDLFDITQGGSTQHIYVDNYGTNNGVIEDLDETTAYAALKTAISAKVNELTPTVAKEIAAWFADTDNAPTGAAPEWLPTALYAKANTLTNGTERFNFIRNELFSAHGVTVTNGGAGGTGATVTTFILSKGDGYDVTFDWGTYSTNGFNGNSKASPELYRNLVFDVIKAGWKLVNETNNTKRSDWLDQDLDITGNNVELVTYGQPNYDWWIYFNVDGLRIPILSGGIASDPMFYNKHTINPHDTYMTEVEFQTLVTFVTYMRDNFDRLKAVTGEFTRNLEIIDMADSLGASYSYTTQNGETHWRFTNKSNGNFNELRVQSNWTHGAGTDLGDLNPDSFVKFYAKCRGIILGL